MDLRNCPGCGKIFNFLRTNLCPECQKKEEDDFKIVRKYIATHPGASVVEVSQNTDISEEKVLSFLHQGRLFTGHEKKVQLNCELCGKAVVGERYCVACREKLTAGLKRDLGQKETAEKSGPRMHTADLRRRRHQ